MLHQEKTFENIGKFQTIFAYIFVPVSFSLIITEAYSNLKYSNQLSIGGISFTMISLQFLQVSMLKGRPRSILITICTITWLILAFVSNSQDRPTSLKNSQQLDNPTLNIDRRTSYLDAHQRNPPTEEEVAKNKAELEQTLKTTTAIIRISHTIKPNGVTARVEEIIGTGENSSFDLKVGDEYQQASRSTAPDSDIGEGAIVFLKGQYPTFNRSINIHYGIVPGYNNMKLEEFINLLKIKMQNKSQ